MAPQSNLSISLYQPDIPQNTGTIMRLCACFAVPLHIIEPTGFVLTEKAVRRSVMDYGRAVDLTRHASWQDFIANPPYRQAGNPSQGEGRIVLFTTKGATPLPAFRFQPGDSLLFGRESAGVPDDVHQFADERIVLPMMSGARSLNLALTTAMALGEAMRQLNLYPDPDQK